VWPTLVAEPVPVILAIQEEPVVAEILVIILLLHLQMGQPEHQIREVEVEVADTEILLICPVAQVVREQSFYATLLAITSM